MRHQRSARQWIGKFILGKPTPEEIEAAKKVGSRLQRAYIAMNA